jgi:hypothetical protein
MVDHADDIIDGPEMAREEKKRHHPFTTVFVNRTRQIRFPPTGFKTRLGDLSIRLTSSSEMSGDFYLVT